MEINMPLGQQSDYGYMDAYSKRRYGATPEQDQYADQFSNLKSQAAMTTAPAQQAGASTDTQPFISKEFAQGAQRGASGGLGSMVMQGGLASTMAGGAAGPYGMAAGLGLMALEGDAQARQAEEEAKAQEAQMRKQQQLSAINSLIAVSKGLGV